MRWPDPKFYQREWVIKDGVYRVRYVDQYGEPRQVAECSTDPNEITMLRTLRKDSQARALLHEIHHAFEFEYDFEIPHKTVYMLERCWFDFLKKNF